jgi:hypothetical protein
MASTQHGSAPLPRPSTPRFSACQQQSNPNPQLWTMRALLVALTRWVRDDVALPASAAPRIADRTLVPPEEVRFPRIPANTHGGVPRPAVKFLARTNPLHVLDIGPQYRAADSSGIVTIEPPRVGARAYRLLVPQVDADGSYVGGVRSVHLRVPVGTYTDGTCSAQGCSRMASAACRAPSCRSPAHARSGHGRSPSLDRGALSDAGGVRHLDPPPPPSW